ncbi:MAG TPA: prenyltransferase/squalene oxidase repeat-containing protein [Planctomycetota bacterium]
MRSTWLLPLLCSFVLVAQEAPAKKSPAPDKSAAPDKSTKSAPRKFTDFPVPEAAPLDVEAASKKAIAAMLALQEGEDGDQWPYEGVYREDRASREDQGQLPVGYRVGGTSIACLGLIGTPGYRGDEARKAAVARGLAFVLETLDAPRMQIEFIGTYDVRGWGHIYALELLLQLEDHGLVPPSAKDAAAKTKWLVKALVESAIPETGGWNYSRPKGYQSAENRASTFMTAPALQALFHAKSRGHDVPDAVVTQALDALERSRAKPGGYAYGAPATSQAEVEEEKLSMMDKTPSSAARAVVCETTLMLAGRGDPKRLDAAIDRFFAHWDDLAVRKSQTGTHIKPYGIAPYYFLFGHVYCAQGIEHLASAEKRDHLRAKMRTVLARSREGDGSWNDRQFGRSGGYGTAFALLTLHMPNLPKPATWAPGAATPGAGTPSKSK